MATHESPESSYVRRLRSRLGNLTAFHLGMVGFLAVPGWLFESLAFMSVFGVFFLFFLWPLVAPLFSWLDDDEPEPTDWIYMGDWRLWAKAYLMIPVTFLNPVVLVQDLLQTLGAVPAAARHRGSVPDPDSYEQRVSYRLPVEGTWTVVNGGHDQDDSHSWFPMTQRYAYDFVITDEDGRSRPAGSAARVENYYCYGEPVLAPADGIVVDAYDCDPELSRADGLSHPLKRDIRGGFVVLRHAPDEYSSLVHLVPGSLEVDVGEHVTRGQTLARCGHSGNSSEPHLHFQLQDHPTFEFAAGLPLTFDDCIVDSPFERIPEDGGLPDLSPVAESGDGHGERRSNAAIRRGQRVRADEQSDEAATVASEAAVSERVRRWRMPLLSRFALGLGVAGVVAFVAGLFASGLTVAALLGGGAVAGVLTHVRLRWAGYTTRQGWAGSPAALALLGTVVAATSGGVVGSLETQTVGVGALLVGFLACIVVGEYDRRWLSSVCEPTRAS